MKKIYYILEFIAVAFTACQKQPFIAGAVLTAPSQTINYTLAAADYQTLPTSVPANAALAFIGTADANQYVPTILNAKYGTYPNGSVANITYNTIITAAATAPAIKLADSVYNSTPFGSPAQPTGLQYTLVNPDDYALYSKNNDLSAAQVLAWLKLKYTAPLANQLEVLTWILYPTIPVASPQISSGMVVSTSGTPAVTIATGAFLYTNNAWVQAYYITPAQYVSVARGQYNQFISTDDASLVGYLNFILKADPAVAASATIGAIKYVSFNYYSSTKITSQRVIALAFNGSNWVTGNVASTTTPTTATFTKANGVWAGDPTVYYTVGGIGSADLTLISKSNIGGTILASDLASTVKYGDFDTYWISLSPNKDNTWLNQAFVLILTANFPTPKLNTPYKVSFPYYVNSKDVTTTYSFTYNGTAWVPGQ
jgi:hypothetical protein